MLSARRLRMSEKLRRPPVDLQKSAIDIASSSVVLPPPVRPEIETRTGLVQFFKVERGPEPDRGPGCLELNVSGRMVMPPLLPARA